MNSYNSSLQQTSLNAYDEIQDKLGEKQQIVFDCFKKHGDMTNMELADRLGWSINRVTPRTYELVNKIKYVVEVERRPCLITGRTSIVWGVK